MTEDEEWSLKGKKYAMITKYNFDSTESWMTKDIGKDELHEYYYGNKRYYLKEDIDTLREKLIEDIEKLKQSDREGYYYTFTWYEDLVDIINRRFGRE